MNLRHLFDNLEEYLCVVLLVVMSGAILCQILFRFVFELPLRWTEELGIYVLSWVSFMGASVGVKRWAHIGVEAFVLLLPKKLQSATKVLSLVLSAVFFAIMVYFGCEIVNKQIVTGQVSPAMRIPMYYAYLSVPVGGAFMFIRTLQLLHVQLTRGGAK